MGLKDKLLLYIITLIVSLIISMAFFAPPASGQTTVKEWVEKAESLNNESKYNESVKALNEAIKLEPNCTIAWYEKSWALYNQIKYIEAIKSFDEAIRLYSNNNSSYLYEARAWFGKGQALGNMKEYGKALDAYNMAIKLNPKHERAWYERGQILLWLEKYDEAIASYDKAIEIDPMDDWAWTNKSKALYALNRPDEARKAEEGATKAIWASVDYTRMKAAEKEAAEVRAAFNASHVKFTPGPYNSSKVDVPIGPYRANFLIRSISDVCSVANYSFSRIAGYGRTYRENNYIKYGFSMVASGKHFEISITRYLGPKEYPPEDPDPYGFDLVPDSWDYLGPDDRIIDGHDGSLVMADPSNTKNPYRATDYIYSYSLSSDEFVIVRSNMDWDKDISLAVDTLHITSSVTPTTEQVSSPRISNPVIAPVKNEADRTVISAAEG